MPRNRTLALAALVSLLVLSLAASAGAATVTLGYPLTETFMPNFCSGCTLVAAGSADPGAVFRAPSNGTIVRWRILDGSSSYRYKLRVVAPGDGGLFIGSGASAPESPAGEGIETFATSLPIKAGEEIGIDLEAGAPLGFNPLHGEYAFFEPPLADGATEPGGPITGEASFDADMRPAPTISALTSTEGFAGTQVTIAGTDFAEVGAVHFGPTSTTFNVLSENQIVATAPLGSGTVPITVTTPGGTATAAQSFTYAPTTAPPPAAPPAPPCIVPKLKGKTLKSAKKRIRGADCRVGALTRRKGAKARTGEVVKQTPKPGASVPTGTKVTVTLGP